MNIKVRTSNSQRNVQVSNLQELNQKIKEVFKLEDFTLFKNREKTEQVVELSENQIVYLNGNLGEPKEYKEEPKCKHSNLVKCSKCEHLNILDSDEKHAKYLSYGSYLEILNKKSQKEEVFNYKTTKCGNHSDKEICSKCMEKQITLKSQLFRKIDYVEFDDFCCIDHFTMKCLNSAKQQIGILLGRYDSFSALPHGRKAIVSAIWEVDQLNYPDGCVLQQLPPSFMSTKLSVIGVIYSDIVNKNGMKYSNKGKLGYTCSTLELNLIDDLKKHFGVRDFLGICIREMDGNFEPEVFMVTEQFSALREHLNPTTNPVYYYSKRNISYNSEDDHKTVIPKNADHLVPLDYFYVNCPIGYKCNPIFDNGVYLAMPTLRKLQKDYFKNDFSFSKFKNFYILMALQKYLKTTIVGLLDSVIENDEDKFNACISTDEFSHFKDQLKEFNEDQEWACRHCTFMNTHGNKCEMCGLDKD